MRVAVYDDLSVRIHYLPERQLDNGGLSNRILRLEVSREQVPESLRLPAVNSILFTVR